VFHPQLALWNRNGVMCWPMWCMLTLSGLIFGVLGTVSLHSISANVLKQFFGWLCVASAVVFAVVKLRRSTFPVPVEQSLPLTTVLASLVAGCLAGVFGSLTGVGGPPLMIFVLYYSIPSALIKLTYPASGTVVAWARFAVAFWNGDFAANGFAGLDYAGVIAGGWIGLFLGHRIGRRIGEQTFAVMFLSFLFVAAIGMLSDSALVLIPALAVATIGVVASHLRETTPSPSSSAAPSFCAESPRCYDETEAFSY